MNWGHVGIQFLFFSVVTMFSIGIIWIGYAMNRSLRRKRRRNHAA